MTELGTVLDGKYEILSGKNRTNAVRQNGGQTIRAIVKDVDDCEAVLMITEANLKHREILHPSEKGWAYRLQLEAIRRQIRKMVRRCKKSVIFLRKLQKKLFSTWQKWGTISIIPFFLKKKSLQSGKAAYTDEMRREKASGCPVGGRNGVESGRAGDGTSPADAAGAVAGAGNHCGTGANRRATAGRRWRKR